MKFDSLLGRALRLPLRLIPSGANVRVQGGLNRGLRWRVGSATHGCWMGHYERDLQRELPRLIRPGTTCYDLGANAGFFTLSLARLVGPSGRVYAFEPNAGNAANLLHHVRINGFQQVVVMETAISDSDGIASFSLPVSRAMGKLENGDFPGVQVPTMRLDTLIEQRGFPAPDFIKIDIEGAELAALRGASSLLSTHHPTLALAFHGDDLFDGCLQLLFGFGYTLRDLGGHPLTLGTAGVAEAIAIHPSRAEP